MDAMRKKSLHALIEQDPRAAVSSLDKELRASPRDDYAWYLMGVALFRLGSFAEAAVRFDQSSKLNPQHVMTFFYIGLSAERLSKIPDAVQAYRRAYKLNPTMNEAREKIILLTGQDPAAGPAPRMTMMPVVQGHIEGSGFHYGRPRPIPGSNSAPSGRLEKVAKIVIWILIIAMFVGIGVGGLSVLLRG